VDQVAAEQRRAHLLQPDQSGLEFVDPRLEAAHDVAECRIVQHTDVPIDAAAELLTGFRILREALCAVRLARVLAWELERQDGFSFGREIPQIDYLALRGTSNEEDQAK
jgi:predicted kinase